MDIIVKSVLLKEFKFNYLFWKTVLFGYLYYFYENDGVQK